MKLNGSLSLALASLALAASAQGAITGTTGLVTQIGAPPSAMPGALASINAWTWDEQQAFFLPPMFCDLSTNPSGTGTPVPGVIPGQFVDSHFIHFEGPPGAMVTGTVTFMTQIVGVQYMTPTLDSTDALATTGTIYPTGFIFRDWDGTGFINVNANVISFDLIPAGPFPGGMQQIRVFTRAVPTPGAAALFGLGALAIIRRRR